MATCSVPNCTRPARARTWCVPHWKKWRRHGDPLASGRVGRERTPAEGRFWAKVAKSDGCWEWTAYRDPFGYGRFKVSPDRQLVRTHRFSWELAHGPIPPEMCVLHRCDNPPCVRPDHLFLGSHRDNAEDRGSKGRHNRSPRHWGETHTGAKLTTAQVGEIRTRYAAGGVSHKHLATEFGVCPTHIGQVVRHETRKNG